MVRLFFAVRGDFKLNSSKLGTLNNNTYFKIKQISIKNVTLY